MKEFEAIASRLCREDRPSVLATLATVEGSSYRRPGARMLVTADGTRIGGISGGCLEEDIALRSRQVAKTGRPEVAVYDTTADSDLVWGVGLGCHGTIRILIEPLPPRPEWARISLLEMNAGRTVELEVAWGGREALGTRAARQPSSGPPVGVFLDRIEPPTSLAIFGAGDDAQPLARLALGMGWRVRVADPRPAFATEARFPGAAAVVTGPPGDLAALAAQGAGSAAVVMTHHYRHDLPILRSLLPLPLAYMGLLGPRLRSEKILSDIEAGGLAVTPEMRGRLHAPMGLDLGADGPEAVALSIVAEIASVIGGRDAAPLRGRRLPIHA
jgi:xanthine/CO dehydrogenase XdhC/CoxF family maturation factor